MGHCWLGGLLWRDVVYFQRCQWSKNTYINRLSKKRNITSSFVTYQNLLTIFLTVFCSCFYFCPTATDDVVKVEVWDVVDKGESLESTLRLMTHVLVLVYTGFYLQKKNHLFIWIVFYVLSKKCKSIAMAIQYVFSYI